MGVLEKPWARIDDPTPIPEYLEEAVDELDDVAFAELVRDNLIPRTPTVRKADWEWMWTILSSDDVADRTYDVLDGFLDAIEKVRAGGEAGEAELKRVTKFETNVKSAWARMERELPEAAKVHQLVFAVTKHRALTRQNGEPTQEDQDLWRVLRRLHLDPEVRPRTS